MNDFERYEELTSEIYSNGYLKKLGDNVEYDLITEKIQKALEHYDACNSLVLTGEDAVKFYEYNQRELTQEEKDDLEEASKYFEEHDHETIENKKNRGIAERLQAKIKNMQDQIEVATKEDICDIEEFKLKERLRDLMDIRDNN